MTTNNLCFLNRTRQQYRDYKQLMLFKSYTATISITKAFKVMFKTRAAVFYRDLKPRGACSRVVLEPIKHVLWVFWTALKTILETEACDLQRFTGYLAEAYIEMHKVHCNISKSIYDMDWPRVNTKETGPAGTRQVMVYWPVYYLKKRI